MSDLDRLVCSWCRGQSAAGATSCHWCGAPLDVASVVSDSGWRAAPRLRDQTRFAFSTSTCQVEGEVVPVAELALGVNDWVFFEHHVLLWKDPMLRLGVMGLGGGLKRLFGGMPFTVTTATGPGRIAFSRDSAGELVVLPLHPGMEMDAREHSFVVASHSISYSFERIQGLANVVHGGAGMYLDRFVTAGEPGLLVLHGSGNVFEKTLGAGESILVEPGAFLYKDASVAMQVEKQDVKTSAMGGKLFLVRMTGPGRVGIQSMYHPHAVGRSE